MALKQQAWEWYDRHLMPKIVGGMCSMRIVTENRRRIVPEAYGHVLEVGIGPGHNLPLYDPQKVRHVYGVDPVEPMTAPAQRARTRASFPVDIITAGAEAIPLADRIADCAVLTYTACTLPDVPAAMAEIRRVLKPGGTVLFCEHGESCDDRVCRQQHRLNPLWSKLAGGCQLTRNVQHDLAAAGFAVEIVHEDYSPWTPKAIGYTRIGRARLRA